MSTVRGIEAIKHYMPPTKERICADIMEERGQTNARQEQPKLMTSVDRYIHEWTLLLHLSKNKADKIRDIAFRGSLKVSKFRSIYWALLLRALNPDPNAWLSQRQQQRQRYEQLKTDFVKNPHDAEGTNDDPLSQSKQSIWNQYFNDQELIAIIKQDVVRTFPGVDFFRKSLIQNAMCNILFYYAREHPYMNYRQGMHEILAPLLFVLYGDQQSLLHFQDLEKQQILTLPLSETLQSILNVEYLEADTYILFARLMSLIESYYRVPNLQNLEDCLDNQSMHSYKMTSELEVIGQLNSIRDKILLKEDIHLHNYLMKLEIPLHIFGIRWLRLLFGREFPLLDLLMLWDAIFADSDSFRLPNFILVAMLIRIRDKLLLSDFTTCMTYLMRYPSNVAVNVILQHALHMHMPNRFDMPANAFVYLMNPRKSLASSSRLPYNANINADDIRSAWSNADLSAVLPTATTTLLNMHGPQDCKTARSSSFNVGSPSYIDDHLVHHELRKTQTVIKIAYNRLQAYLATLRKNTEPLLNEKNTSSAQEVRKTLDDMEELCNFLNIKSTSLTNTTYCIDQAMEANEIQLQQQRRSRKTPLEPLDTKCTPTQDGKIDSPTLLCKTLYERPDSSSMSNSKLLANDIKDFELLQISKADSAIDDIILGNATGTFPLANPLQSHNYS